MSGIQNWNGGMYHFIMYPDRYSIGVGRGITWFILPKVKRHVNQSLSVSGFSFCYMILVFAIRNEGDPIKVQPASPSPCFHPLRGPDIPSPILY